MFDLLKRMHNKNAVAVTQKLLAKYPERFNSNSSPELFTIAKLIYKNIFLDHERRPDGKEVQEIFFLIDNIEIDEQNVVNYFRSILSSYDDTVDQEIRSFFEEADDIMSQIGN
ncbi:hypothetical protein [Mucilaginibacter gotjawali]|uniref:Uncharacterized protein n=2 Tax=Mucilaginibacter gotjawali TaxID=1550579 RepID=A0A839SJ34_9SPHI|nr:hypothetical protein [Mucilaginibacter gotjawali]MBB3057468.1 hypothetical protein [Mucilaginibacter gotjawali]BAU55413.1 hypothetical protein MgSA37_03597 [Mucilaginibacter gotjawali]